MATLATRTKKLSGVLRAEFFPELGYSRKVATVTFQSAMDVGAVLQLSGGKYIWVQASGVASLNADVVVLIETDVELSSLSNGDQSLLVLHRTGVVVDSGLLYQDALSAPQKATVRAALEAKGIQVVTGV